MPSYPPPATELLDACIEVFRREHHNITLFGNSVREFFSTHPKLTSGDLPTIHSVKGRIKSEGHLREKIVRKKVADNRDIGPHNLLAEVTDLFGVRVLHLYLEQFPEIHQAIMQHVSNGHWTLFEPPNAYTWDPEFQTFFNGIGIETKTKESNYTSVHYVVRPNNTSSLTCEIQVRTLFEEVWGEIDHAINYPAETSNMASKEQIRVLAKIVGAGTRLATSIFRTRG